MNFHILAKKNLGPGVAYNKFTTVRPVSCCSNDQANGAASKNTNLQIVNTQPQLFNECNEVGPSLPSLRYHKHAQSKYSVKRTAFCEHPIAS